MKISGFDLRCALILIALAVLNACLFAFLNGTRPYFASAFVFGVIAPLAIYVITDGQPQPNWRLPDARKQLLYVWLYVAIIFFAGLPAQALLKAAGVEVGNLRVSPALSYVYFLGIPGILFATKVWLWPTGLLRIGRRQLALTAGISYILFGAQSYLITPDFDRSLGIADTFSSVVETVIFAASEEVIFRVMLLSYLCAVLQSRLAALVISSLVFGWIHFHVLGMRIGLPVNAWFSHEFLYANAMMLTGIGLFLGTVWIRTRSVTILIVSHSLLNLFQGLSGPE